MHLELLFLIDFHHISTGTEFRPLACFPSLLQFLISQVSSYQFKTAVVHCELLHTIAIFHRNGVIRHTAALKHNIQPYWKDKNCRFCYLLFLKQPHIHPEFESRLTTGLQHSLGLQHRDEHQVASHCDECLQSDTSCQAEQIVLIHMPYFRGLNVANQDAKKSICHKQWQFSLVCSQST